MKSALRLLALYAFFGGPAAKAVPPTVIEFDAPTTLSLPYTEGGLTFSEVGPSFSARVILGDLRAIGSFAQFHIRGSSAQPFDLLSVENVTILGPWRFVSSAGATQDVFGDEADLSSHQTFNFAGLPGWSNITHFDIIFAGTTTPPRRVIFVDRVTVATVPEPSFAIRATIAIGGLWSFRRRA
jgi:hypothetical protein